jgi:hypothetical protein
MTRFYEILWRTGVPPREALRAAQLAALRAAQLEKARVSNQRDLGSIDEPKTGREAIHLAAFVLSADRL